MNLKRNIFIIFLGWAITFNFTLAQTQTRTTSSAKGFVDADKDGINDLFADADGDGVNDITNLPYPHLFKFKDSDGDGVNDIWVDADGDGVNDRLGELQKNMRWVDTDGDGIAETQKGKLKGKDLIKHVLDADEDGRNDITGAIYSGRDILGYRFGKIDEENGIKDSSFVDKNGDGMNDHFADNIKLQSFKKGRMDLFIDADGDGIADNRGLKFMKDRGKMRGKK